MYLVQVNCILCINCSTGHFIPINPPLPLSPSMILVLCFDASFPLNLRDLLMMTSLL